MPLTHEISQNILRRLDEWKSRLIDLTKRNRLLYFQPHRGLALTVDQPDAVTIFERVYDKEKKWQFWLPLEPQAERGPVAGRPGDRLFDLDELEPESRAPRLRADQLLCDGLTRKQLEAKLKNLHRRSRTDYQERGVRTLYFAFGSLVWKDENAISEYRSPLILCPVDLSRESAADPFEMEWADEDLVLNPALDTKLKQDFRLDLPTLGDDLNAGSLAAYFDEVSRKVRPLSWRVEPTTYLGLFSFHKLAIYQDLLANAANVSQSSIIQGLAGDEVDFDELEDIPRLADIDKVQRPAETFQIMDADSSQQQAIEAALRGHNIVLHGPPGTGKSQTIANIIAEFIARGKSVLFVSEKMAALEVVYKRLAEVHLNEYCLELHSHKANKREVIQNLNESLDTVLKPSGLPGEDEFEKLEDLRADLNTYVSELHQKHFPLGLSIREVLERIALLQNLPDVRWTGPDPLTISPSGLLEWERHMEGLEDLWDVAEQGNSHLWHGCRETAFNLSRRILVERILEDALLAVRGGVSAAAEYTQALSLNAPSSLAEARWLVSVGHLVSRCPGVNSAWFMEQEPATLAKEAAFYLELSSEYWREHQGLLEDYSVDALDERTPSYNDLREIWGGLENLGIGGAETDGSTLLEHLPTLITFLHMLIGFAEEFENDANYLRDILKFPVDELDLAGYARLSNLARYLTDLTSSIDKPESSWLDSQVIDAVDATARRLRPKCDAYNAKKAALTARREKLLTQYDASILKLELSDLIADFSSAYFKFPLKLFVPKYYRAKRTVLSTSRAANLSASVVEDLIEAREIVRAESELATGKPDPCAILGRFDREEDTDFEHLNRAMSEARTVVDMLGALPVSGVQDLIRQVSVPVRFRQTAERSAESVSAVVRYLSILGGVLPVSRFPGYKCSLEDTPLASVKAWATEVLSLTLRLQASVNQVLQFRVGQGAVSIESILLDIARRERLQQWQGTMQAEADRLGEKFGERYKGLETTWSDILAALDWTTQMCGLFESNESMTAVPKGFIDRCSLPANMLPKIDGVEGKLVQLESALSTVKMLFDESAPAVGAVPFLESDFASIETKLIQLIDGLEDLKKWVDFHNLNISLSDASLDGFLPEFVNMGLESEQVVTAFRKSFYFEWLARVCESNKYLTDFRTANHERRIEQFRESDRGLVRKAAQSIIKLCNEGRPSTSYLTQGNSEVAILRREGTKKRKHLPVRLLFNAIPNLILRLKPCIMMSPLSVSQFLPSEPAHFDLLIFDEASQIFTEDAVGAIYRASQILVAGDSKQMPPTDFFRTSDFGDDEVDDSEDAAQSSSDYASVLDEIQTIDGIAVQQLRWHYRSRHESLIAFSNNRFYNNKLVTFPSARESTDELGVGFVHVPDGVYDRGGKRHNPREAEVVADLVFEHFRERPKKSLGVVAFSQAQMIAIDDEIERRLTADPKFKDFFTEDRLEGFFVKNLENVQGDERDFILFSVGYGRDRTGRLTMSFGPLNRDGGERRLNVAVTRAREKVVLVSSIRAADMNIAGIASSGVLNFHRYLDYAERGINALDLESPQGLGEAESPLEEDIASEIRRLGFDVIPQVGCSGYRVDMGVVDPARPGQFVLGVEADGATYHSAYTARDRDRLRQQVLERLGWRIHRIWSPDWITQRSAEIRRLEAALRQNLDSRDPVPDKSNLNEDVLMVSRSTRQLEETERPPEVADYEVAEVPIGRYYGNDFHSGLTLQFQMELLSQIVAVESPIHIELAARRLIKAWYLERVTEKVVETTRNVATSCFRRGLIEVRGDFLWTRGSLEAAGDLLSFPVRGPNNFDNETRREVRLIPSEEIQSAVLLILKHAYSIDLESLIAETRKVFGFSRSGENIRGRLDEEIRQLESISLVKLVGRKVSAN